VQSRPTRTSSDKHTPTSPSLEGLRPLAYPCPPPHQPQAQAVGGGLASGRRLAGPFVFPQRGRQCVYTCTLGYPCPWGHIQPSPVDPSSPKARSPMSPKPIARYPCTAPHVLSPRMQSLELSLAGPRALLGLGLVRSSSTRSPASQGGGRGYIETSPPQKPVRWCTSFSSAVEHHQQPSLAQLGLDNPRCGHQRLHRLFDLPRLSRFFDLDKALLPEFGATTQQEDSPRKTGPVSTYTHFRSRPTNSSRPNNWNEGRKFRPCLAVRMCEGQSVAGQWTEWCAWRRID
jgi:hypothetical protein